MLTKSPMSLEDILLACARILEATSGRTLADYQDDWMLRAAIERQFGIIGEALVRIENADPDTANRITDYRKIIGFRNVLAHNYDDLDDAQVWEIIQLRLPILLSEVEGLLREAGEEVGG